MTQNDPHINIFTLPNGLRCVHRRTSGAVSYIGVAVNAGSRDEAPDKHGLAHFVEHTIFKGTRHRSSWHISNRMESVGGELNAYTSKEETVVYTAAPAGDPARALDLLADLIIHSSFPTVEVEREREVVAEEIKSYLDSPADTVYDVMEELMYAGSAMAHNILGSEKSLQKLGACDCRGFIEDFYTPDNMVLYMADPTPHSRMETLAHRYFAPMHLTRKDSSRLAPAIHSPFTEVRDRNGYQAHTLVAARVPGRLDERRFPLFLLNNYLGGPCMNSRLNQEMRERRGYVYTVDSSLSLMSDCGLMLIYFGSDRAHVDRCRRIINRELETLARHPMSQNRFDRIRRQYIGQLLLSTDHHESAAMSLGKSMLYYNEVHDAVTTTERIRAVTPEQLRNAARSILDAGLSSLTLC